MNLAFHISQCTSSGIVQVWLLVCWCKDVENVQEGTYCKEYCKQIFYRSAVIWKRIRIMGDQLDPDSGGQKSAENLNLKKENLNLLFTLFCIVK